MRKKYILFSTIIMMLITLLLLIGLDYKNSKKINNEELVFKIYNGSLDCNSVILEVYEDNTYKYYYAYENDIKNLKYQEGTYKIDVKDFINKRNENIIEYNSYVYEDEFGKKYNANGISKNLKKLLDEIEISLNSCLVSELDNVGADYLEISYDTNFKYFSKDDIAYFYEYNAKNNRYEKIDTYEGRHSINSVDDKNGIYKLYISGEYDYLYINLKTKSKEEYKTMIPMYNTNNNYEYIIVSKNNKYGIIDKLGKKIYDLKFSNIGTYQIDELERESYIYNKLITVKENDKWGILNIETKEIVVGTLYENVFLINEDLYFIKENNNLYIKSLKDSNYISDGIKINISINFQDYINENLNLRDMYVAYNNGLYYELFGNVLRIKLMKDYDNFTIEDLKNFDNFNGDIYEFDIKNKELTKINW